MMSVPARWSELYFDIFAILCAIEVGFLVWYEVTRRPAPLDYVDVAMSVVLGTGAVGLAAAIQAFALLKVRDGVMMTWETFAARREERGRRKGREEGKEEATREMLQRIRQIVPRENGASALDDTDDLDVLLAKIIENPESLEKLRAMLREMQDE